MKIIDTDIAIDHFHGHRAALDYFAENIAVGQVLAVSVVTLAEFLGGMREGEQKRTERLLHLFTILDAHQDIARRAAFYLRQFRSSHRLELGDALIAATAAYHNAELVTRNRKHYPMQDIAIVTPYERGK
ncbi:MAG: twitching motility protein PilT [Chloroflexota bacterium]|nr:MAG: twitching motility protein PilT [Chloroflexota bacterium]